MKSRLPLAGLALALALAMLAGCNPPADTRLGVYMLLDTSGTYTRELNQAQKIINATLVRLNPGDSFAVARIDTASFSEKDIIEKVTLDDRPSRANQQKRKFQEQVDSFVGKVKPAGFTDISGGLLQAIEYLNEKQSGQKIVFIFSDLKEDLQKGYIRDLPLELGGFEVVALNVTKLRSDNIDPREYLQRLDSWRQRVESGGGRWRVINDIDRLERLLPG